jgi:hypothetical protein
VIKFRLCFRERNEQQRTLRVFPRQAVQINRVDDFVGRDQGARVRLSA